jgi:hypothetical protein
MAIAGNLRTMQLSELLQWLSTGLKTGTLVVRGAPGEKRIYFQKGRVTSSSSTLEREFLGRFLVGFGFITEEELLRALEVQAESKVLLGKILVMIGAIKEEELTDLLRLKAAETIYDVFLWDEGSFAFLDGEVPQLAMVPISTDVTGLIMEGLRRYDEWQRIKTRILSLREIPEIVVPLEQKLEERERLILNAINGKYAIDQIAMATHNPDFYVAKFVFDLLESGHVRIVGERPQEKKAPAPVEPEEPAEPVFVEAIMPAAELAKAKAAAEAAAAAGPPPKPREEYILAPPGPKTPAPQDFGRFLKRGPDSAGHSGGRIRAARPKEPSESTLKAIPPPPVEPAFEDSAEALPPIDFAPTAVPLLTRPMEDLMSQSFTPNEAFIVSRINGMWDVRSITRISPFPEGEVLRTIDKLQKSGVVKFK